MPQPKPVGRVLEGVVAMDAARPALLMVLHEIERQVHKVFQSLERDIERL